MYRGTQLGRRLGGPVVVFALTFVLGTIGYMTIEGWSFGDAWFMVVTTVFTVGYGEVQPLSPAGRAFTSLLILLGVGTISYSLSVLIGSMVEGNLTQRWERRRMERRVHHVRDHHIVCGYGRVGRQIVEEFGREGRQMVVIDVNQASLTDASAAGNWVVYGNATEDDTLRRAGIERARGLITAVASDADNIFVTLSARALRPDLPIVARANQADAIPKLRRAGATQVVSPYAMAGTQMARLALRPSTVDFVETLMRGAEGDLLLEDVRVGRGSPVVGLNLEQTSQRFASGILLLAVQRDGTMHAPPPPDLTLHPGDVIAVVGSASQLRALELACEGSVAAPVVG